MTIPHLMNCPHSPDGWCLSCARELGDYAEECRAELRKARDFIRGDMLPRFKDAMLAGISATLAKTTSPEIGQRQSDPDMRGIKQGPESATEHGSEPDSADKGATLRALMDEEIDP
jgi:hypothetical protein